MLRSTSLYSYDEGQQYSEFRSIWNKCIISPFSLYKFLTNLAQIKWYCLCRLLLNYNRKGGERSSGLKFKTSFDFTKMISCSWENKYEKYCHFGFSWYSCAILSTLTYFMPLVTAWKVSKYGVISGPYFPAFGLNTGIYPINSVFSPNTGKYGPEITPYFGTFHAVGLFQYLIKALKNPRVSDISRGYRKKPLAWMC